MLRAREPCQRVLVRRLPRPVDDHRRRAAHLDRAAGSVMAQEPRRRRIPEMERGPRAIVAGRQRMNTQGSSDLPVRLLRVSQRRRVLIVAVLPRTEESPT